MDGIRLQRRNNSNVVRDPHTMRCMTAQLFPEQAERFAELAKERDVPNGALLRFLMTAVLRLPAPVLDSLLREVDILIAADRAKKAKPQRRNVVWG